jgi:hypothetical protein
MLAKFYVCIMSRFYNTFFKTFILLESFNKIWKFVLNICERCIILKLWNKIGSIFILLESYDEIRKFALTFNENCKMAKFGEKFALIVKLLEQRNRHFSRRGRSSDAVTVELVKLRSLLCSHPSKLIESLSRLPTSC